MDEEYLPPKKVCQILSVKEQTLACWRLYGENLPFIRVGRLVRYRRSDIETWLTSQTVQVREG
ncbi:MAG: helix-turn-helix domain-containing protein [Leptospirillum sp.]